MYNPKARDDSRRESMGLTFGQISLAKAGRVRLIGLRESV